MRVITGTARGRKLKTPSDYDVRPTTDNVKESIFNIISFDIEGRRVLDLFAGTGQMGIEAISRGAGETVFVDNSLSSIKLIKENLDICGFKAPVIKSDALSYIQNAEPFDVIFIDPPYDSTLYEQVLEKVNTIDLLKKNGIIIVEARKERALPDMKEPYFKKKEYIYGKVKVVTFTKEQP